MLADNINIVPQSGRLNPDIHFPSTAKRELVCFIAERLPQWRDDPERPNASGETKLTEYLCDYLNGATYYSTIWDHIQFRAETSDETWGGRKIDLTVKPRATGIIIANQRYCQYNALFPIECKRLPTPKERDRDEREYVITKFGTTGGIQRFKFGHHGATHTFAAMIAYVQEQSCSHWLDQVNGWIQDLAMEPDSPWTDFDSLKSLSDNLENGVSTLKSEHQRAGNLERCELYHLWIEMRKPDLP
jgi:hypothetical protein